MGALPELKRIVRPTDDGLAMAAAITAATTARETDPASVAVVSMAPTGSSSVSRLGPTIVQSSDLPAQSEGTEIADSSARW